MIPQAWMAMWAGVQKESRPMDMCQEISQYPPMTTETEAAKRDQMYQGTASVTADRVTATAAEAGGLAGKVVAIGTDSLG